MNNYSKMIKKKENPPRKKVHKYTNCIQYFKRVKNNMIAEQYSDYVLPRDGIKLYQHKEGVKENKAIREKQ